MKIAMIGSRGFPGIAGGVEKALEEICPRLAAMGHEVTVYGSSRMAASPTPYKRVTLKPVPALPTKHLETISRTFLAASDAAFRGFDVVHFHSIGPSLLSWIPKLAGRRIVVTVHGLDWQRDKWGPAARAALRAGERCALRFADEIIVVSKHLERYFRERHRREVHYVPNGVSPSPRLEPRLITQEWGLRNKDYILFASRLVPEKGCHTLIEAWGRVRTDRKLVIAGGSWHSDAYAAKLREAARGNPNIVFTGWAEGDALKELFSNAYAYCLPSSIEGLSLSLLEAMSYGVCPIVSDIPENTDVAGAMGVVFKTGDASDLGRKIGEVLADSERAEAAGRAAGAAVKDEYDWQSVARRTERVYASAIGGKRPC